MRKQIDPDPELVAEVEKVVRHEMDRFGLREVAVSAGRDHDGEPVIFVDLFYPRKNRAVDVSIAASLGHKVRERVRELNEPRFAHLRHNFADDQKVVGF